MVYSWTGPLGFTSDLQRPTIPHATLDMAGTYYLTVTTPNGCSDTTSTYVEVRTCATPPDTPTNISPSPGTCVGLPVTLTASAFSDSGSGEYQVAAHWQIRASRGGYSDPVFDSVTDIDLTSITIPPGVLSDSSSYLWHVRYQGNLGAWSDYSSETFFGTRPVATASSDSPIYAGDTIQLYGGPGGMVYSWTGPNGFSSFLQNPTIPSATSAMAGNYVLIVTSSNGCTDSDNVVVSLASENGQGGPPAPPPTVGLETYPIDKLAVLAPWTTLLAPVIAGAGLLLARRRRTQS